MRFEIFIKLNLFPVPIKSRLLNIQSMFTYLVQQTENGDDETLIELF
jgi:hypothetical protein